MKLIQNFKLEIKSKNERLKLAVREVGLGELFKFSSRKKKHKTAVFTTFFPVFSATNQCLFYLFIFFNSRIWNLNELC